MTYMQVCLHVEMMHLCPELRQGTDVFFLENTAPTHASIISHL